jgi:hypothetical protein
MKRTTAWLAVLAFAVVAAGCGPEYSRQYYRERPPVRDSLALMTKQDIIALSKSRIGDNVIISMINSSGSTFHLRTPDVIELADSGVSDTVIAAMLKTDELPPLGGERHYAVYPAYYWPDYWWAESPWWSPWYISSYWGFWGGFYGPYHYPRAHYFSPRFYGGHSFRSYGGFGSGGVRSGGGARSASGRR